MSSVQNIPAYILYSSKEENRKEQIDILKKALPNAISIEAIFPAYQKVPFLKQLIQLSQQRTGKVLVPAEIGVLLGHRHIWKSILNSGIDEQAHVLVLESDSKIKNLRLIEDYYPLICAHYDLFFWGAWDGNTRLKRSSLIYDQADQSIGEPLIKSVYCTYGYSLNKKSAKYLLKATGKISYPVDMYKKYIPVGTLALGAARPEIISAWYNTPSSIQKQNSIEKIKRFCIVQIFDLRNRIQAYFS